MQIDFHHGVTYVVARLAGFEPRAADVVAHSAQYVDDATVAGTIHFANGAQYTRIASAHRMLDYKNMDELAAHHVWLPFHFLPGNRGEPPPDRPPDHDRAEFLERCVCRPDSHVARWMMRDVVRRQDRPYALHRLGIASHVYVDTWAHQNFVGYQHVRNKARDIATAMPDRADNLFGKLKRTFGDLWDDVSSNLVADVLPLGHGAVLSFPDQPYLKWEYVNGLGERIVRDNPADFSEAARALYRFYRCYLDFPQFGEAAFDLVHDIPPAFADIDRLLREFTEPSGEARHARWLDAIAAGTFGFSERPAYRAKGLGSWKQQALGTYAADHDEDYYEYRGDFLRSDWKHFHDALQAHRLHILNELLPRFGLVSA